MKGFGFCLKKDWMECIRRFKLLVFVLAAFGLMLLVYAASIILPVFVDTAMAVMPELLTGGDEMARLIEMFFPKNVRDSISLLSSDLLVFYTIVVIVTCNGLLPNEYKKGRWNMPRTSGYGLGAFVWSKGIVYSLSAAAPMFLTYVSYYYLITSGFGGKPGATGMYDNLGLRNVLIQGLVASLCVAGITLFTVFGSVFIKSGVLNMFLNIAVFLFCPDVFAFFSFGKYLPTYALEFSKMGYVTFNEVWIPLGLLLALAIVIGILGIRRLQKRINS